MCINNRAASSANRTDVYEFAGQQYLRLFAMPWHGLKKTGAVCEISSALGIVVGSHKKSGREVGSSAAEKNACLGFCETGLLILNKHLQL